MAPPPAQRPERSLQKELQHTHKELVRMDYKDFARIVAPKVLAFGVRKKTHGTESEVTA